METLVFSLVISYQEVFAFSVSLLVFSDNYSKNNFTVKSGSEVCNFFNDLYFSIFLVSCFDFITEFRLLMFHFS